MQTALLDHLLLVLHLDGNFDKRGDLRRHTGFMVMSIGIMADRDLPMLRANVLDER